VVIQEIFGVNGHIRRVVDGYAAEGFLTIAPALFDRIRPGIEIGYSQEDIQRGIELKGQSRTEDARRTSKPPERMWRARGKWV
jgi:carboxymethylenebutenolidase